MPNSEKTKAAAASAAHAEHVDRFRWFIMLGLITAAMMEILDTTIINVALPRMAGNLSATQEEIAWVSTSYILANVVVLPMTAFFTEIFGRKRYLTFSILMFIAASFLCGTAHSLGQLILYRLMQGAGGAALLSTAQATLRQIFPKEEQGLVQAIFMLGVIVAPTLGPTLGGWITDNYDWKWCFFINVPVGLMSAFLVGTFLHDSPENLRHRNPVDWFGISLLIAGVGSLQYVLEEGNRRDWFADQLLVELAILSVVSLTLMVWWELSNRNKHPIIDFRVLHNRDLAASIFLFVVLGFGLFGGTFLFPLFTQGILGFKPTDTGMAMMPGGIATMFTALLCGKLLNGKRPLADTRLLIMIGMSLFAYAMWNLGHLTTAAGEADARYPLIIRGIALGFLFVPINNAAFGSITPNEAQQASGLINLSRQLGGSFGIAILGAYLTRHIAYHRADLAMNTYVGNPAFDQRYQGAIQALIAQGTAAISAPEGAMALVQAGVMRQAAMLAYNDAWMLILISFLAVIPAVFLLRKPSARARIPMEAH